AAAGSRGRSPYGSTRGSYQPFSSWKSATNIWSVKTVPKPSSPSFGFGLCVDALTTRIASVIALLLLEDDWFPIQAEDLPVHVGHLAQRDVVLDRLHEDRHHVVPVPARLRELLQPSLHLRHVARGLPRLHAFDLR